MHGLIEQNTKENDMTKGEIKCMKRSMQGKNKKAYQIQGRCNASRK